MKKTTTAFTAQLVTYETTLPFHEVIARLNAEVNKPESGGLLLAIKSAKTKKDIVDIVNAATGDSDLAYFFEMSHDKWLNVYRETETETEMEMEPAPPAVVYTIGNPLIAERFLRHDVRAGYAIPPRLMVVQSPDASLTTVFYHLPSALVVSDSEEVLEALRVVDDKLEQMITRVTTE